MGGGRLKREKKKKHQHLQHLVFQPFPPVSASGSACRLTLKASAALTRGGQFFAVLSIVPRYKRQQRAQAIRLKTHWDFILTSFFFSFFPTLTCQLDRHTDLFGVALQFGRVFVLFGFSLIVCHGAPSERPGPSERDKIAYGVWFQCRRQIYNIIK